MADLFDPQPWQLAGQAGMEVSTRHAAQQVPQFTARASAAIVAHLARHGQASGEELVTACRAAGICPGDDRAFGSVFGRLKRDGRIVAMGTCVRTKGHGTAGGTIYRLGIVER